MLHIVWAQKLKAQPEVDVMVLYCGPIQLIYRGRWGQHFKLNWVCQWLREGCAVNERFPKERNKGKLGKYRYNCFLEMVREVCDSLITHLIWLQKVLHYTWSLLSLSFHTLFWRTLFSLYSYLECISAIYLDSHCFSFGCLSHQGLAGRGNATLRPGWSQDHPNLNLYIYNNLKFFISLLFKKKFGNTLNFFFIQIKLNFAP